MKTAVAAPARDKAKASTGRRSASPQAASDCTAQAVPMLEAMPKVQRSCACGGTCPGCSASQDRIQTRLKIGAVDDPFEREADRVAARILAGPVLNPKALPVNAPATAAAPVTPAQGPLVRRSAKDRSGLLTSFKARTASPIPATSHSRTGKGNLPATQSKSSAEAAPEPALEGAEEIPASVPVLYAAGAASPPGEGDGPGEAPGMPWKTSWKTPRKNSWNPSARLSPEALTSGGFPLPDSLRSFFEARFGRDLSEVRLHTGPGSGLLNDGLHARAFTYGSHIWLGRGHAPAADFLLAHELAHVVQQRQPRLLPPPRNLGGARAVPPLVPSGPAIRRLELGFPFWVPLGPKGAKTGTQIHKDLLGAARTNNTDLDIEAPAPNANAKAWGLGLQGSIDLYRGENNKKPHAVPGLFFDGTPGAQNAKLQSATPKKHPRAAKKGSFHPSVKGNRIDGIAGGPDKADFGELKPAAKDVLNKGATQLGNYKEGMKDAVRLTNAWAAANGKKETWNLKDTGLLTDAEVKFGKGYAYNPSSPKDDVNLVLATIIENPLKPGDYVTRVRFNPAAMGLPPIKGGLYAMPYTKGSGLFMYFARPKSLTEALRLPRSALVRGEFILANQVQDEVINPILKAPQQVAKLPKEEKTPPLLLPPPPDHAPETRVREPRGSAPLDRETRTREAPIVRRAPKKPTPKLEDKFDFKAWKTNQAKLRAKIHNPAGQSDKQQLASLELLEVAYQAEEKLDAVPGTGKSTLPDKSKDPVKVVTGAGKDRKESIKPLGGLFGWLKGWTGKPAEVLGFFRDKFGDSFVRVANKFIALKDKIKARLQKHFENKSGLKGKSGKVKMILQALGKALIQVAKILLPRTIHLVMSAIEAGIKKKLAKVFDIDPVRFLADKFGERFQKWIDPLAEFKKKADTFVKDTIEEYTKDLGWISNLIDLSKTIGPIIDAAAYGLQCVTPPVWGCLKILAKKLTNCAIATAMNICKVQKEIAAVVAKLGPLANLPAFLGQKIMNLLKKVAPKGLEDIFDEPIGPHGAVDSDEVECEYTPIDPSCPSFGLIKLEGGVGAPPAEGDNGKESGQESGGQGSGQGGGQDAAPPPRQGGSMGGDTKPPSAADLEAAKKMRDFSEKLTKKQLEELAKEAERQGLSDKPFDQKQAEKMLKDLEEKGKGQPSKPKERKQPGKEPGTPPAKQSDRPPAKQPDKDPGKDPTRDRNQESGRRAAKPRTQKGQDKGATGKSTRATGKPKGDGKGAGGTCIWTTDWLEVSAYILEPTSTGGENILNYGSSSEPFDKNPIKRDCAVSLIVKNDFNLAGLGCERPGKHTKPVLKVEITFNGKELFNQTDNAPRTAELIAEPKWSVNTGARIKLPLITQSGALHVRISMVDPDSGTTRTLDQKVNIVVETKDKCCDCIS